MVNYDREMNLSRPNRRARFVQDRQDKNLRAKNCQGAKSAKKKSVFDFLALLAPWQLLAREF
jgi:hypothetical protein